jgi:NADPH:quinone reductase-like Zn-dependent oxidoreductase
LPDNSAAWFVKRRCSLEVGPAPYPSARADEIIVRNYAVATNPIDWIDQCAPGMVCPWIKMPFVLGSDLAGEVVEVGSGVTRFRKGDRVVGHAVGTDKKRNRAAEGAFQQYTVVLGHMAAPIPPTLSYECASVLPLGLSTAACGLFQKDQLAFKYPSKDARSTGETLLIWGGSTSVGSNAIQLAVAAGYEVITTASLSNFEYVKGLGASQAFDYKSSTVVEDLIEAFRGKTIAGALAIGSTSASPCVEVVHASKGNKVVSLASFPLMFQRIADGAALPSEVLRQAPAFASFGVTLLKARARGIRTAFFIATSIVDNEVSRIVYVDFLPSALADGRYIAAPGPLVVGRGLASIEPALEVQRKGVSATKVVVSL